MEGKDRRLEIRLSEAELGAIDAAAEAAGMTRSAFVLAAATGAAGRLEVTRVVLGDEAAALLRGVAYGLARAGGNLNQVAHRLNLTGKRAPGQIEVDAAEAAADLARAAAAGAYEAVTALMAGVSGGGGAS